MPCRLAEQYVTYLSNQRYTNNFRGKRKILPYLMLILKKDRYIYKIYHIYIIYILYISPLWKSDNKSVKCCFFTFQQFSILFCLAVSYFYGLDLWNKKGPIPLNIRRVLFHTEAIEEKALRLTFLEIENGGSSSILGRVRLEDNEQRLCTGIGWKQGFGRFKT